LAGVEGYVHLTNSTVSGNDIGTFSSTGIWDYGGGSVVLQNSTLSGNEIGVYVATDNERPDGFASLWNTIVGNSGTSDCCVDAMCSGDVNNPVFFTDFGDNFADDDSCPFGFADIAPGSDFDTTLADNGGPTMTHALLPASVAIDAAGECGLDSDQRGFPRDDGACDSGSVEFQGGADTPASSQVGLIVLVAVLVMLSWTILRPKRGTRRLT
jgi:hypothetical protein